LMRKGPRLVAATAGWILAATCLAPYGDTMPGGERGGLLGPMVASASGVAQVRFVNALRGVDGVMVDADDHLAFAAVQYRVVTPYAEVGARGSRFVLRTADGRALATYEGELDEDVSYSLIATRDATGEPMLAVVRDQPHGETNAPMVVAGPQARRERALATGREQVIYQQASY
jgi:hypothetical protein